jgi:hypothetical protein
VLVLVAGHLQFPDTLNCLSPCCTTAPTHHHHHALLLQQEEGVKVINRTLYAEGDPHKHTAMARGVEAFEQVRT